MSRLLILILFGGLFGLLGLVASAHADTPQAVLEDHDAEKALLQVDDAFKVISGKPNRSKMAPGRLGDSQGALTPEGALSGQATEASEAPDAGNAGTR